MFNKVPCFLLLLTIEYARVCIGYDYPPEVETPLGNILGSWKQSFDGRTYAAFEGIPYAKPPIGPLRFEEPQPVEPWLELLNATEPHTCIQSSIFNYGEIEGDEDCLYLNVYVPTERIGDPNSYDVLVNIHGGGFLMGSGHMFTDSTILMDRDLIVVSINYRLGILGFLSTEDEAIPGNNGLKDQVLALKWVKDNIASFGGNPDSVTISGLSAGGVSVHLHYFSPMSKGLFVRGLSQSGNALIPWAIKKNPLENAKKLARLVACPPDTSTLELKECLKEKPAKKFIEKIQYFSFDHVSITIPFAPVIEKGSANPFLTQDPYLLLKEKKVLDLPWITSTTAEEGLLSTGPHYKQLEKLEKNWPKVAHYLLEYNYSLPASKREEVAMKIKEFYLGPGEHINKQNFKKFTQIFTDRLFVIGAEMATKLQSRANKSPVYYYFFNYKDEVEEDVSDRNLEGVGHGADMVYFYSDVMYEVKSDNYLKLKELCQDMLYSYARTGKPSFDGTDNWLPTTDSELIYLNITGPENMQLQRREHLAPSEFWRTLGFLENENFIVKDEL